MTDSALTLVVLLLAATPLAATIGLFAWLVRRSGAGERLSAAEGRSRRLAVEVECLDRRLRNLERAAPVAASGPTPAAPDPANPRTVAPQAPDQTRSAAVGPAVRPAPSPPVVSAPTPARPPAPASAPPLAAAASVPPPAPASIPPPPPPPALPSSPPPDGAASAVDRPGAAVPPASRPPGPAAASVAPAAPAPSPAPPAEARPGFEALLGGRVFVWIGAVALALAGAFLVKYSWDNQLLSPLARTWLAAAFALGLIAAAFPLARRADRVAAGCAAAGVSTLYGVVFAASSVYGFVGSGVGFVLMAAVTAAAVALSLRFGSFVALLGLVGGFLTPALIGGEEGGRGTLVAYLVVLQTGLVVVTRQRGWIGLSVLTLLGSFAWAVVTVVTGGSPTDRLLAGVLTLATAAVFVMNAARLQQAALANPRRRAGVLTLAFAGVGAAATLLGTLAFLQNFSAQELSLVAVLSAGTCVLAWWDRRYAALPWLTLGLSAVLAFAARWTLNAPDGGPSGAWYAVVAGYGGLFALAGYAGSWSPRRGGGVADGPGAQPPVAAEPMAALRAVPSAARWATLGVLAAAGFAGLAWVLGPVVEQLRPAGHAGFADAFRGGHPAVWVWPVLPLIGVPFVSLAAGSSLLRRPVAAAPWVVGGFGLVAAAVGIAAAVAWLPAAFAAVTLAVAAFGRWGRTRGTQAALLWPLAGAAALAVAALAWVALGAGAVEAWAWVERPAAASRWAAWAAVGLLAAAAWLASGWPGDAAVSSRGRPVIAWVEAAAVIAVAVAWLATVRDVVAPGSDGRLPFLVTSLPQVSWLASGWSVLGLAVLSLRRFDRPAAAAAGQVLVGLGAAAAAVGLVLVLNPLWNPSVTTDGARGAVSGWGLQLRLLVPVVVLWFAGTRVPSADLGRFGQGVAAAVFGVAAAVAVRQAFGDGGSVAIEAALPGREADPIRTGEVAAGVAVAAGLAAAAGWRRWPKVDPLGVLPAAATAFAGAALFLGASQLLWFNPLWNPAAAGGLGTLALRWVVPAAILAAAAWALRAGRLAAPLSFAAAVGGLAFGVLAVRWWNWGTDPRLLRFDGLEIAARLGVKEAAVHAAWFLAPGVAGLLAADRGLLGRFSATVRGVGAVLVGVGAGLALVLVAGVCNPLWRAGELAAAPVLNGLGFAWGLPAVLVAAAAVALGRRAGQPPAWRKPVRHVLATAAVLLAFGGVTLLVRHGFSWPDLTLAAGVSGAPEWWGYSVAWLGLGIALLAAGVWRGSAVLRYASLAVLLLAIGKVFLFDVAALGGLFRVASFLGLGLTLMALGIVYQRFVFRPKAAVAATGTDPPPPPASPPPTGGRAGPPPTPRG